MAKTIGWGSMFRKGRSTTLPPFYSETLAGLGDKEIVIRKPTKPIEITEERVPSSSFYVFKNLFAGGGMGTVWDVTHHFPAGPGTRDDSAFKRAAKSVPDPTNKQLRECLVDESHILGNVQHDGIVSCLGLEYIEPEHEMDEGRYFMVMPYIPGIDLDGLLNLHRMDQVEEMTRQATIDSITDEEFEANFARIPDRIAQEGIIRIPDMISGFIVWSVARTLKYVHDQDFGEKGKAFVHGDLKKENIRIKTDEGCIKVLDFGIARTTQQLKQGGMAAGTLPYISPEVLLQEEVDTRADIYSLGVVLYELLTGFRPNDSFQLGGKVETNILRILKNLENPLVPPHELVKGVNRDLSEICCKMLEVDPARRYQTAAQVKTAIAKRVIFKKYGPTTDGLRDYLAVLEDKSKISSEEVRDNLYFLRQTAWEKFKDWLEKPAWFDDRARSAFCDYRIFAPYVLTRYAKERLSRGENPARLPLSEKAMLKAA